MKSLRAKFGKGKKPSSGGGGAGGGDATSSKTWKLGRSVIAKFLGNEAVDVWQALKNSSVQQFGKSETKKKKLDVMLLAWKVNRLHKSGKLDNHAFDSAVSMSVESLLGRALKPVAQ